MNWKIILLMAVVIAVVFLIKRAGQISAKDALAHLKHGALVIDVRTPGEFNSGHLTNALNIPLDEITEVVPRKYPDKNQVFLLHCASGMRSGVAQRKLKKLGYTNIFNLGSYRQAEKITASQTP